MATAIGFALVESLAGGKRGSADLVAYFYLRAFDLLQAQGAFGLLATNTIAQGDTREVGLDQLAERAATIVRAVPSEPWPGTTSLEIAKVWVAKGEWKGDRVLSGSSVRTISPMLIVPGRAVGKPYRLKANESLSFIGSYVLGMGFVMSPEEAQALIDKDPRNRDVLFPYLNGEDLNSRPDQSPSRWVINFQDWPLDRSADGSWRTADEDQRTHWLRSGRVPNDYGQPVSADYPLCLAIVERDVRPEPDRQNDRGGRLYWWRFLRTRPELYSRIAGIDSVPVRARIANRHAVVLAPTGVVFNEKTVVFPSVPFEILQSSIHEEWAREYSSTLKRDLQYTPSDCFETYPLPHKSVRNETGVEYQRARSAITVSRNQGLTLIYNSFHDSSDQSREVLSLRELQVTMDRELATSYGWANLQLGHDFRQTPHGIRFTISDAARREVMDRLLELNHVRYQQEVEQGLHESATTTKPGSARAKAIKRSRREQIELPTAD